MKKKVYLATPTRDGKTHGRMMLSVMGLQDQVKSGKRDYAFAFDVTQGSPNIPRQRNWFVARAKQLECDAICFIDSDIEFDPDDAFTLFDRPERVIGASHQARPRNWTDSPSMSGRYGRDGNKIPPFKMDEDLIEASKLTTGFLYVKMDVFDELVEKGISEHFIANAVEPAAWPHLHAHFMHYRREITPNDYLKSQLEGVGLPGDKVHMLDGEDWDFNERCIAAAIPMHIEPLMPVRHYEGSMCMNLDLMTYWLMYQNEFNPRVALDWIEARADRGCEQAKKIIARGPIGGPRRANPALRCGS